MIANKCFQRSFVHCRCPCCGKVCGYMNGCAEQPPTPIPESFTAAPPTVVKKTVLSMPPMISGSPAIPEFRPERMAEPPAPIVMELPERIEPPPQIEEEQIEEEACECAQPCGVEAPPMEFEEAVLRVDPALLEIRTEEKEPSDHCDCEAEPLLTKGALYADQGPVEGSFEDVTEEAELLLSKEMCEEGLHGRGLYHYRKWWKMSFADVVVNGDMLSGTTIFTDANTLRVVNEKYSYFIPLEKVDYIRTTDGLHKCP